MTNIKIENGERSGLNVSTNYQQNMKFHITLNPL